MCTGIEIAMIASTAVSTVGAVYSGMQQKDIADDNAELARRQGEADKDAAIAQAGKIRKATRQQAGQATAALASSGVSVGEGTALRINEQIYRDSEEDAYNTILTGTRRQATSNAEAGILRQEGRNAQTAGLINAGSSVLAGGAKVGQWRASQK